jgi:hypothetical protein
LSTVASASNIRSRNAALSPLPRGTVASKAPHRWRTAARPASGRPGPWPAGHRSLPSRATRVRAASRAASRSG